jgi:hypothetical protein
LVGLLALVGNPLCIVLLPERARECVGLAPRSGLEPCRAKESRVCRVSPF